MSGDSPLSGDATKSSGPPEAERPPLSRDVFISYASQDAAVANAVVEALERSGIRCWIAPRDVTPGEFYADSIVHAIDAAQAMVLVLSQHAAVSHHILREIERASSKRHPVISLRIDRAALPAGLEYFLNTSQWLDASDGDPSRVFPKLVEAVRKVFAGAATGVVKPAESPLAHESTREPKRRSFSRPVAVVLGLIVVAIFGFAIDKWWGSKHIAERKPVAAAVAAAAPVSVAAIPQKSVAVLPFVDMSEKKDQEYFADGLSEELIDHLAHVSSLKVIARTSSFQFKNKSDDMRTIGQRLGAANLLEGSVRTSGKTVRVTAQLISASDGSHLWSQTYDRDMRDIFKVQDAIAAAVVASLQAAIAETSAMKPARPVHPEAYKAVLRGRYFLDRGTKEYAQRSIDEFKRAQELDATYATALAELARAYNFMGLGGWMLPKAAAAKAREAADIALKIDPSLALAHRVRAAVEWNYDYDFAHAAADESRATDLDPNSPEVTRSRGLDAIAAGRPEEGVGFLRSVVDRDPLNAHSWNDFFLALWDANQLPEAERAARTIIELSPQFEGAHCTLGGVLLDQRRLDEAIDTMRAEPDEASRVSCLPDALWALGRHSEADAMLTDAEKKYADVSAISFAQSYARRNDKDAAFRWLDRAFDNREPYVTLIKSDRTLRGLHGDPRWNALLRKMKLPE